MEINPSSKILLQRSQQPVRPSTFEVEVLAPIYTILLAAYHVMSGFPPHFIQSQWTTLPLPTHSFAGQTIIVTGSNTGLGLEGARHLVRLGASKVILGVRNLSKGEAAKASIEASENSREVVDVWELDLARYESVKAFAKRVEKLDRLDVLVGNAGVLMFSWQMAEEDEMTITVNVVSTFFLSLLVLPKLRETSIKYGKETVLTFTGSFVHYQTDFPERNQKDIFAYLAQDTKVDLTERYNVSKMILLLLVRELSKRSTSSEKPGNVSISCINPGYVITDIMRDAGFVYRLFLVILKLTMGRTAEVGGRTIVHGAEGGAEKHGQYLSDCQIGSVSAFVTSEEGRMAQKKVWDQLSIKMEGIQSRVMENI